MGPRTEESSGPVKSAYSRPVEAIKQGENEEAASRRLLKISKLRVVRAHLKAQFELLHRTNRTY
jgi:hypothetical protein